MSVVPFPIFSLFGHEVVEEEGSAEKRRKKTVTLRICVERFGGKKKLLSFTSTRAVQAPQHLNTSIYSIHTSTLVCTPQHLNANIYP